MAKKLFFCYILLLCNSVTKAQLFALEYDSINPYVTALPYPRDGNYRVVSFDQRFPAIPINRTKIKVYDSALQYLSTINLLAGITLVNDYPPLLHGNRLLWPANHYDARTLQNSLVILELDTNYNFIALHSLSTHSTIAKPTGIVAYSQGFVVGEYFNGPLVSSTGYSTKLYKLNLNFVKTDSALFLSELRLKTHTSYNNKIVGASDSLAPCTPTIFGTQKIVLDTNLAIIDCLNIPVSAICFCYDAGGNLTTRYGFRFKRKSIIFPISNYRTYIHGEADRYDCSVSPHIKYKAINSTRLVNNSQGFSDINENFPDNTEFPLYQSSNCDYVGASTINVGVIGLEDNYLVDKNFYRPYYAKTKTRISLTKTDTVGNLLWRKEYGGDMNYFARSVVFTADGGCLVAGSRYDSASFYANGYFENFMMKVDAQGMMVGMNENKVSSQAQLKCFPNPSCGSIFFDVSEKKNITVQICNSTGQVLIEKRGYLDKSPVEQDQLEKGLYLYRVKTDVNVYVGKIVKE